MTAAAVIMVSDLGADSAGAFAAQRRSAALRAEFSSALGRVIVVESIAALEKALAANPGATVAVEGVSSFELASAATSSTILYDSRGPGAGSPDVEAELVSRASLVVSETDVEAERLRGLGARASVVFRGSIIRPAVSARMRLAAQQLLVSRGTASVAAVVGGSGEAGAAVLLTLLGTRLGYLDSGKSLLLADDLAATIGQQLLRDDPFYGAAFLSRVFTTDPYRGELFGALVELADALVIQGGDASRSRLSVPEAILTGLPVLLAADAIAGYEDLAGVSTAVVVADPAEFRSTLVDVLTAPPVADSAELERLRAVYALSEGRQELAIALASL